MVTQSPQSLHGPGAFCVGEEGRLDFRRLGPKLCDVGLASVKEVISMKQFLRDVLTAFVAAVLAAMAVHLMNL